jgi:hypothetical protein
VFSKICGLLEAKDRLENPNKMEYIFKYLREKKKQRTQLSRIIKKKFTEKTD